MKLVHDLNSPQVSRRMLFAGGLAAGAASSLGARDANATVRLSPAAVRYSAASRDGRTCSSCKLFAPPAGCLFVDGAIDPNNTCWIWRGKT